MISKQESILMVFERIISKQADHIAFEFITQANEKESLTFQALFNQSQNLAAYLQQHAKVGDRVLLSYLPGLDFIISFVACLYAGLVAVPAYPLRSNHHAKRFLMMLDDCQPKLICGTKESLKIMQRQNEFAGYHYVYTDEIDDSCVSAWIPPLIKPENLAFLQYTSGSTGSPKGVMVNHANILSNERVIQSYGRGGVNDTIVFWIPMQHDMGLIGGLLYTLYAGTTEVFMAPALFLSQPFLWLKTISDYQALAAAAPNFGYELCVDKIKEEQLELLDLNCWRVAMNGSEPIRKKTLDEFVKKFSRCGFNKKAFLPCYGMAETTLMVSCKPYNTSYVTHPFEQSIVVSSGQVHEDYTIKVVNPETKAVCAVGEVGELWLHGSSIAQGYWHKEQETKEVFHAHLDGDKRDYLRTGDMGFLKEGELYVTGRLKDLIILQGRNLYPQDVERVVELSHEAIRKSCVAAVSVEVQQQERLIVLAEIERTYRKIDFAPVFQAIRQALIEELEVIPYSIQLLAPAQTLKTTSGKIQRKATKEAYLKQSLVTLAGDELAITTCIEPPSYAVLEEVITQLLKKVLAVEQIDRTARFSELGGTSLQAVVFHEQLQTYLGELLELPPSIIFDYPTITSLSAYLDGVLSGKEQQKTSYARKISFADNPIAIVGMACRFPGQSSHVEAFWRLLSEGRDGIGEVPVTRWDWHNYAADLTNHRGGFIERIEWFAPEFFNISPREAMAMDPQQRILLETTWEAFEHACIPLSELSGSDTGVFVGATTHEYSDLLLKNQQKSSYIAIGNSSSALAGRLSYTFGLQGPCLSIDTACSSSLVALAEACEHLHLGETSLAIVAGVNALLTPEGFIQLSQANMLSKQGYCQVFSEKADGYVRGEGCGVILLKRLDEAQRDNDRILGVIKSAVVNQDGASSGFTVPNGAAQEKLIRQALMDAQLSPKAIDYVEAHGTGTVLGDPMEVHALTQVFAQSHAADKPLILGSVKANIGHLEAAAGIAGLIKILLSLEHEIIPPQIHVNQLNPKINLQAIPAQVPFAPLPWPKQAGRLRRAGISSFGFTGTNAHLIIEESSTTESKADRALPKEQLIVLSAKTQGALLELIKIYTDFLKTTHENLADISYSVTLGRSHFNWRFAVIVDSKAELIAALTSPNLEVKEVVCSGEVMTSTDLRELSAAYLAGKRIDWRPYYDPYLSSLHKISLPTYCFNRQPYWLEVNKKSVLGYILRIHELLGNRLPIDSEEICFLNTLSLNEVDYLKGHCIFGTVLMPGAGFLESALAAGQVIKGSLPIALRNVNFIKPFNLAADKYYDYQLSLQPQASDYEGKIAVQDQQDRGWERQVNFQLSLEIAQRYQVVAIDSLKVGKEKVEIASLYVELQALGIDYGRAFQTIIEAYREKNAALVHLSLSEELNPSGYWMHPTLLDGAFQAIALLSEKKEVSIPSTVTSLVCYQPLGSRVWADLRLVECNDQSLQAEISFYDEQGVLLAEVIGLRMRSTNKSKLLALMSEEEEIESYVEVVEPYVLPEAVIKVEVAIMVFGANNKVLSTWQCVNSLEVDWSNHHVLVIYTGDLLKLVSLTQQALRSPPLSLTLWVAQAFSVPEELAAVKPECREALGFWRSFTQEAGRRLPTYFIDSLGLEEVSAVLELIVANALPEPEIILREGHYFVPRLYHEADALKRVHGLLTPIAQEYLVSETGIDDLHWQRREEQPLGAHQLRIRIEATALNFKDVLNAMHLYPGDAGELGGECAGVVLAVGRETKNFAVGQRVVVIGEGLFAAEVMVDAMQVCAVPAQLSQAQAASIPIVFLTTHYGLIQLAQLQPGQKVLIHAATGGVGLAAIALARMIGAEIYATASQGKQWYLREKLGIEHVYDSRSIDFAAQILADTHQSGVDVVLNSLTSEGFIAASLSCLKTGGVFLEIAKLNIYSQEQMQAERPDIRYYPIALDKRLMQEPELIRTELENILALFEQGKLTPLPIKEFSATEMISAFHYLQQAQQIGKVVITQARLFEYKADATYLITGGAGGLGLALANHLIEHGVKHLVLTSRSPASEALTNWIATQGEQGIEVKHESVDVTDEKAMAAVLAAIAASAYPLKGLFHTAGVLHDGLLQNLADVDFKEVLAPKVAGSQYLDQLTRDQSLDCFVLFSSAASLLGSPGQTNYSAANAFMDGLAQVRRAQGLAALSVNWGPFAGVGMAASLVATYEAQGMLPLQTSKAFDALDRVLMTSPTAQVCLMRANLQKVIATPYLSHLIKQQVGVGGDWFALLEATPLAQRDTVLIGKLRQLFAETLLIHDANQVDINASFFDMGIDSLMAMDLKNKIQYHVGKSVAISNTFIFEYESLKAISAYLLNQFSLAKQAETVVSKTFSEKDSAGKQEVISLYRTGDYGYSLADSKIYLEKVPFLFDKKIYTHSLPDITQLKINYTSSIETNTQSNGVSASLFKNSMTPSVTPSEYKIKRHQGILQKLYDVYQAKLTRVFQSDISSIKVEGVANIPAHGPLIIAMNHVFWMDFARTYHSFFELIKSIDDKPCFVIAQRIKFLSWLHKRFCYPIYMKRNHSNHDLLALSHIMKRLKQGKSLIIVPEGKQNRGRLLKGKEGVAYIALEAHLDILPVAIYSERKQGKKQWIIRFGSLIKHSAEENNAAARTVLTHKVMREIATLLPEKMRGVYRS